MGQTFQVQVLNDKEFDSLPYDGISESMGFADVKKGLAFVRSSGNKEFDLGTVSHEVNHLIEKHGKDHPDWESGILHKKFKDVLKDTIAPIALGLIPGIGPVLAGAYSGINNYQSTGSFGKAALSGGLGFAGAKLGQGSAGFKAGVEGSKAAGGGLLGQTLSGAKGMAFGTAATSAAPSTSGLLGTRGAFLGLGTTPASAGANALTGAMGPSGNSLNSALYTGKEAGGKGLVGAVGNTAGSLADFTAPSSFGGGSLAPVNLLGMNNPATSAASSLTPTSSFSTNPSISTPSNVTAPITAPSTAPTAPSSGFSFKDLATPANIMGAGSLMGAMGQQTPQFQMPDSVDQLRQKIMAGNGLSPLGQQAQTELGNILKSSPTELYGTGNDAYYAETNRVIDEQYGQAKRQLDAAYNNAGQLGSGEYMAELNKLTQAQANAKSSFAQTENQRRFELARTDKYRAIQDSLGVDKTTMDNLIGLTGMDVNMAAAVYGVKSSDVEQMRNLLGTAGIMAITNTQGASSPLNKPLLGGLQITGNPASKPFVV